MICTCTGCGVRYYTPAGRDYCLVCRTALREGEVECASDDADDPVIVKVTSEQVREGKAPVVLRVMRERPQRVDVAEVKPETMPVAQSKPIARQKPKRAKPKRSKPPRRTAAMPAGPIGGGRPEATIAAIHALAGLLAQQIRRSVRVSIEIAGVREGAA